MKYHSRPFAYYFKKKGKSHGVPKNIDPPPPQKKKEKKKESSFHPTFLSELNGKGREGNFNES
jgi:hypothetical protein